MPGRLGLQIPRFPASERRAARLPFGASRARRKLHRSALPCPAACLPAAAPAPLSILQITPSQRLPAMPRLPMTQWWTIAPYRCANAAHGIAANSVVMARLDRMGAKISGWRDERGNLPSPCPSPHGRGDVPRNRCDGRPLSHGERAGVRGDSPVMLAPMRLDRAMALRKSGRCLEEETKRRCTGITSREAAFYLPYRARAGP